MLPIEVWTRTIKQRTGKFEAKMEPEQRPSATDDNTFAMSVDDYDPVAVMESTNPSPHEVTYPLGQPDIDSDDSEQEMKTPPPSKVRRISATGGRTASSSASTLTATSASSLSTKRSQNATESELYFKAKNKNRKVLFAMLYGLVDDCDPEEKGSFWDREGKKNWLPTIDVLQDEVRRRSVLNRPEGAKPKACNSWKKYRLKEWLKENPIKDGKDTEWLLGELEYFCQKVIKAEEERKSQNPDLYKASERTDWIGMLPWLRLGHTLIHDSVCPLYKEKDRWEGRQGTCGRNSDLKPRAWYEVAADIYNNKSLTFTTIRMPEVHADFAEEIVLDGTNTPLATPETIKKKSATARAEILCVIDKWERSGNGEGQRNEDEHEYGSIRRNGEQLWLIPGTSSEFQDGDNRASFLNGRGTHILYLWELFDRNDFLQTAIEALPTSMGMDGDKVPSASAPQRKNKKGERADEDQETQKALSASLSIIARAQAQGTSADLTKRFIELSKIIRQYQVDYRSTTDEVERRIMKKEIRKLEKRRDVIEKQLDEEDDTKDKDNDEESDNDIDN